MIRIFVAVVLILHGLVHLMGFVTNWRLATLEGLPYTSTVLAGRFDLGDSGIRIVGLLWLLAAVGLVTAGISLVALAPWWQALTFWVTLFSLAVTILGLPSSVFGVVINLLVLAYILFGEKLNWLPHFA